jgi:hypothetical protein
MQSGKPAVILVSLFVLSILALAGCGKNVTAANNVTSITISPTSLNVALNTQADFTAQVSLSNSTITTNTTVTWQVNGVDGGNTSTGTIVASTTDVNVGVYTAPGTVPSTNNGQVTITAIITQSTSSSSTATSTITSNSATITIGAGAGLSLTPTQATVPAGGTHQFTAELNSVVYSGVTWTVSSANGGNVGSIDSQGIYSAPDVPPPGGSVTITATYTPSSGSAQTATATAIIVYSDDSLEGPFAFSYTGSNSSGFIAVAGHFVADGAGTITSGVEDIDSFGNSVATRVSILSGSTYAVGADGRTKAVIVTPQGTETWEFVVISSQHALMTRFDTSALGSGTIDQQNLNALNNVVSTISGPYVFSMAGGDAQFNPLAVAGRFTANGAGVIPQSASIVDENDNYTAKAPDSTLNGSYSFDSTLTGSGRGTLTLTSTNLGSLQFAFYIIDNTHIHVVEIDQVEYLAGDIYAGSTSTSFTTASLASGNYVFTAGGNFNAGAFAAGGVFTSDGNGNVSGGALDTNNGGTTANATISQCAYSIDPTTGRIVLTLAASSACTPGSGNPQFAMYQTAQNTAVLLELDSSAVSDGIAYLQAASPASLTGNFGLAFVGQGVFHNSPASYQSDATGHAVLAGTGVSSGNLDINIFGTVYTGDPIATSASTTTTGSSIVAPGSNGRGTATIVATDPPATYSLVYYVVNAQTTLFIGQDKTRVETGIVLLQY